MARLRCKTSIRVLRTSKKCPVCGGIVNGSHHIRPISVGGTDTPRNKVPLCRRCHDIVEMIYDEAGIEYSPSIVRRIRLIYDLVPITSSSVARVCRKILKSMDKRYTSDNIELCIHCGDKFRQHRPGELLCRRCVRIFGDLYGFMWVMSERPSMMVGG